MDGIGLVLASGFQLSRFSGVDALSFLCKEAASRGLKVLLAGGLHEGDASRAANILNVKGFSPGRIELVSTDSTGSPQADFTGSPQADFTSSPQADWVGDGALKEAIERERPDVLALALGHGKQEKWLADHLRQFPFIRLGIGVGGALEFYAGRQKRAPLLLRRVGFEWAYRLLHEPRRIRRIFVAVIVFPTLVFLQKIKHTS